MADHAMTPDDVEAPMTYTTLEGDSKEVQVAGKANDIIGSVFEGYRSAVKEEVDQRRERVDPSEDNLEAGLDELLGEAEEKLFEKLEPATRYMENRLEAHREAIPDLTDGRLTGTGKRTVEWISAADSEEERDARIRETIELGDEETLTALFHEKLPARAAGFRDAQHRQQNLERALRSVAGEAYESYNAIRSSLNKIENFKGRALEQMREVKRAGLRQFRAMLDGE